MDILRFLQTIETTSVCLYIQAAAKQAKTEQDHQWLWFLYAVCERLNIERAQFQDDSIFYKDSYINNKPLRIFVESTPFKLGH